MPRGVTNQTHHCAKIGGGNCRKAIVDGVKYCTTHQVVCWLHRDGFVHGLTQECSLCKKVAEMEKKRENGEEAEQDSEGEGAKEPKKEKKAKKNFKHKR